MAEDLQMDLLMKAVKAFHYSPQDTNGFSQDDLTKQRRAVEAFSHLGYSSLRTIRKSFSLDGTEFEWIYPLKLRQSKYVILYCHGGGFSCGGLGYARILGTRLAKTIGSATLTFAYRLAPEWTYPSQLYDIKTAWKYLLKQGIRPYQIILAGDSAGGNLSLQLCRYLKKNHMSMPAALLLFSPWTDMTASSYSYDRYKDVDPILTKQYIINSRKAYAGSTRTDYDNPDFSPLFADLKGFPPTLVQIGSYEILRHDGEALVKNMRAQGVKAALQVYKGGWHVFQQLPLPLTFSAFKEADRFIKTVINEQSKSRLVKEYLLNQLKTINDTNKTDIKLLLNLLNRL